MHRLVVAAVAACILTACIVRPATAVAGLVDTPVPLLAGQKATHVYSVPGVINLGVGTYFACTSTAKAPLRLAVEMFAANGGPVNDASATSLVVNPGQSVLIGTSAAVGLITNVDFGLAPLYAIGSARILSTSASIICTAFLADRNANPPASMTYLTIVAKTKQKAAN